VQIVCGSETLFAVHSYKIHKNFGAFAMEAIKEVSEKLGISVSGAKSRVQRGRKMMREMQLGCC